MLFITNCLDLLFFALVPRLMCRLEVCAMCLYVLGDVLFVNLDVGRQNSDLDKSTCHAPCWLFVSCCLIFLESEVSVP
jgi:hypothetical protein